MIAVGIDPGSRIAGYGVVERSAGGLRSLAAGVWRLRGESLGERLADLHVGLSALLALHQPQVAAIEGVFCHRAPRSALILGHARGVVLLAMAQAEIPIHEYPPATVKRSLTHGGASSKEGVARAVRQLLGLSEPLKVDATDALAVALCHLFRRGGATAEAGAPSPWLRALAAAPPQRATPQNELLRAALKGRR